MHQKAANGIAIDTDQTAYRGLLCLLQPINLTQNFLKQLRAGFLSLLSLKIKVLFHFIQHTEPGNSKRPLILSLAN